MIKKLLLICTLSALAIGFTGFGEASQWGAALPLGAVFLILFFIVTLLEKETALYDAEHHQQPPKVEPSSPGKSVFGGTCRAS